MRTVTTSLRSDVFVPFYSHRLSAMSQSFCVSFHSSTFPNYHSRKCIKIEFGRASTKTAEKSRLPGVSGAEVKAVNHLIFAFGLFEDGASIQTLIRPLCQQLYKHGASTLGIPHILLMYITFI